MHGMKWLVWGTLLFACLRAGVASEAEVAAAVSGESCESGDAVAAAKPAGGYKIPQHVLVSFLKLHEPADAEWKTTHASLIVTDGCPLNNLYRRFKLWIRDDARAFPGLSIEYTPGMDPVLQFQDGTEHPAEYLGVARVDVSEMEIEEVEALLIKRGVSKDPELAAKIGAEKKEREEAAAAAEAAAKAEKGEGGGEKKEL
uniref:Uncharacterized protein n=2 Tax=Hemiselmis andersenii TaxID=464988 RepID=A0A6U4TEQ1_HEMAN|mmetsp:Transcript_18624/g.44762  ORF Transcript_18624/g.44762 Transcript_18624/m.44762 type:complete len:200 (+) Transcript_18624:17-616(+)